MSAKGNLRERNEPGWLVPNAGSCTNPVPLGSNNSGRGVGGSMVHGYKRGFSLRCVSPLSIVFAEHVSAQGHWGGLLREYMRDFVHWATFGALCELLPQADNRVTLADETDRHGLRVANVAYSKCESDNALIKAATAVMAEMHYAAGADEAITINRYAHPVGGAGWLPTSATGSWTATFVRLLSRTSS